MSQPFELVNLAASLADHINTLTTHESSDDGLDPYEFISHDDAKRNKANKKSASPDKTPTLLSSDLINNSSYLAETISASKLIESFHSFGSLQFQSLFPQDDSKDSSQMYLRGQNEMLQRQLRDSIRKHERILSEGANCAPARQTAGQLLNQLSENNIQLHEVYSNELEFTNQFAKKLHKWNSKRTSVLNKIKLIKSDDNKYGTKLQGLLEKQHEVDNELEELQKRIQLLNSKKEVLNMEIVETVSVLESRSAKYVSLFRNLEKQGKEAVYNYLTKESSSDISVRSLVRSIPVDSGFASLKVPKESISKLTPSESIKENDCEIPDENSGILVAQIGIIPYEYSVSEPPIDSQRQDSTPFERGFSSGAEQIERVKGSIKTFVNHVFTKQPSPVRKKILLDDEQNIITEMMDLEPIIQLLESKSEAMEVFLKDASKLSESYHKDSLLWTDVCFFLEINEDKLYEEIRNSGDPKSIMSILKDSFEYLKKIMTYRTSDNMLKAGKQDQYILALLKNEWNNVAVALNQILQTSEFTSQLEEFGFLAPEAQAIDNKYLLHSRITAAGSDENELREMVSNQTKKDIKKSTFSLSFKKGMKKE